MIMLPETINKLSSLGTGLQNTLEKCKRIGELEQEYHRIFERYLDSFATVRSNISQLKTVRAYLDAADQTSLDATLTALQQLLIDHNDIVASILDCPMDSEELASRIIQMEKLLTATLALLKPIQPVSPQADRLNQIYVNAQMQHAQFIMQKAAAINPTELGQQAEEKIQQLTDLNRSLLSSIDKLDQANWTAFNAVIVSTPSSTTG